MCLVKHELVTKIEWKQRITDKTEDKDDDEEKKLFFLPLQQHDVSVKKGNKRHERRW